MPEVRFNERFLFPQTNHLKGSIAFHPHPGNDDTARVGRRKIKCQIQQRRLPDLDLNELNNGNTKTGGTTRPLNEGKKAKRVF